LHYYKQACGCSFAIDEQKLEKRGHPLDFYLQNNLIPPIRLDVRNIPHCKAVWEMLGRGSTKGVFQLESQLGKKWTKDLKPTTMEHLAALGAILRPGALESYDTEGINTTEHYCRRKNGLEEVEKLHPLVDPVLEISYGLMIYQEQMMKLAQVIAGFNLVQVDQLRKGVGKKIQAEVDKVIKMFRDGCEKEGLISKELIDKIADTIKASGRYSFNKCLALNTLVETPYTVKTIEEIQIGEWVKGPNDDFIEVVNKYDNGNKEVYEITLESGKTITCTLDHQFLCNDGQKHSLFEILKFGYEIMCEDD
jgi:DNA polymerase III subunit alpha